MTAKWVQMGFGPMPHQPEMYIGIKVMAILESRSLALFEQIGKNKY